MRIELLPFLLLAWSACDDCTPEGNIPVIDDYNASCATADDCELVAWPTCGCACGGHAISKSRRDAYERDVASIKPCCDTAAPLCDCVTVVAQCEEGQCISRPAPQQ